MVDTKNVKCKLRGEKQGKNFTYAGVLIRKDYLSILMILCHLRFGDSNYMLTCTFYTSLIVCL